MQGRITQNIIIVVLIVAAVAAFLIVGRLNAQPTGEQPPQSKTPEEAAEQSLEILRWTWMVNQIGDSAWLIDQNRCFLESP